MNDICTLYWQPDLFILRYQGPRDVDVLAVFLLVRLKVKLNSYTVHIGLHTSELWSVTCHMGSTELPATRHKWMQPALTPARCRYSIYLPWRQWQFYVGAREAQAPKVLIGSVVISLSRCCLPNDEGPGPQIFFHRTATAWRDGRLSWDDRLHTDVFYLFVCRGRLGCQLRRYIVVCRHRHRRRHRRIWSPRHSSTGDFWSLSSSSLSVSSSS